MNLFKFGNFLFFLLLVNLLILDTFAVPENEDVEGSVAGGQGNRSRDRTAGRRDQHRVRIPRRRAKSKEVADDVPSQVEEKAEAIAVEKPSGVVDPVHVSDSKHGLAQNSAEGRRRSPTASKP